MRIKVKNKFKVPHLVSVRPVFLKICACESPRDLVKMQTLVQFSRSAVSLRFCISNKLSGDTASATTGPGNMLCIAGCYTLCIEEVFLLISTLQCHVNRIFSLITLHHLGLSAEKCIYNM